MQKTFTPSHAAGASRATAQNVSTKMEPLAPLNLLQAGVPAREVVWFRNLRPDRRFAALVTTRGKLLLETVRAAQGTMAAGQAA
jgi:hypothetical protein